jgi:integrase
MAARVVGYGSAVYGWALKREKVSENPFLKLPTAALTKRERVLEDDEIAAVWRATDGPGVYNAIVRMLVLTGQRREEVAGMTWEELSPDLSTWMLPAERAKNGVAHILPLSAQVRETRRESQESQRRLLVPVDDHRFGERGCGQVEVRAAGSRCRRR